MKPRRLRIEGLIALMVALANVVFALMFSTVSPDRRLVAASALLLSLPGLCLIWFREPLSAVGFKRGIFRESPQGLVTGFGWLFLIGLPLLFLYGLLL